MCDVNVTHDLLRIDWLKTLPRTRSPSSEHVHDTGTVDTEVEYPVQEDSNSNSVQFIVV